MSRAALLLLALLALTGCVAPGDFSPERAKQDYHVRITSDQGMGQGTLIDDNHVATVAHVVSGATNIRVHRGNQHRRAKILRVLPSGSLEAVVILKLDDPLTGEAPEVRPIRPGDSGSPAVGQDGQVIGMVYGWKWDSINGHLVRYVIVIPIDPVLYD